MISMRTSFRSGNYYPTRLALPVGGAAFHKSGFAVYLFECVLVDGKKKPLYFIAQIQDITERKQADEQIKRS